MEPSPLFVAFVGTLPVLLLGAMAISATMHDVADPCRSWGSSWGGPQAGGGTSIPGGGGACPNGTSWTTEAKGYAIARVAWLPVGAIAAMGLALFAIARGSPIAGALAVAILLAISFPLTIGATVFLAGFPTLAVACALRMRGLHRAPATVGVGIAAIALPVALFGVGALRGELSLGALAIASVFWAPLAAAGLVLLLPRV